MKELTIKEVRSFGYQHPDLVKKYDPEQLVRQANAIRYIDHLAGITNTDVSDIKLHYFMNLNENLHVERTEINKIFFELKEKLGPIPAQPDPIPKARLLEIDQKIKDHMRVAVRNQQSSIRTMRSEAVRQWKRAKTQSNQLLQSSLDLMNMEKCLNKGVDLMPMIERVLNSSRFWRLADHGFAFTTSPITLAYYNAQQDAENTVRLGEYRAEIHFKRGLRIKVFPHKDNIMAGDTGRLYHPHVNAEGEICFGNSLDQAKTYESELDLYRLMDLVRAVLSNYNDENPYLHLYSFQQVREGADRSRAMATATPQQLQDIGVDLDAEAEMLDDEPEDHEDREEFDDEGNPY